MKRQLPFVLIVLLLIEVSAFGGDTNDYNESGYTKFVEGDLNGAQADFNKAIELNPNVAPPYFNRGAMKYRKGDLDGAIADNAKAIELKPSKSNQASKSLV